MTEYRYRDEPQPMRLDWVSPRYPSPDYDGEGAVTRVFLGDEFVGFLVRQGDAIGWTASAPPDTEAGTLRVFIHQVLTQRAVEGQSAAETWSEVLSLVLHGAVRYGHLPDLMGA